MNSRWYAVPGYKGKSQHGEVRDPHVLDASGQLVCVCEGLDIAERIVDDHNAFRHWHEADPDGISYIEPSAFALPLEAPPLPDGAVYAGRLSDYPRGADLLGWIMHEDGDKWRGPASWKGMGNVESDYGRAHYAKLQPL